VQRALLLSLITASYLLLAGGPRWTLAPIGALAALSVLAAPRRVLSFPATTRLLDLSLLVLCAAIALQMLPLPAGVVSWLSPHALAVRASLRFIVGGPERWLPLSVDSEATAYALANVILGVVTFWIARATFAVGGTRQFCRLLGLLAAVAAVVAVMQKAAAPRLLMGMIVPEARNANPMGPFLNRNHFAAWLIMCAAITLGYIIAHLHIHPAYRDRFRAALKHFLTSGALLSGLGVIAMISAMLMTLSRSAAIGLAAAAMFGGWLGRSRLRVERTRLPALSMLAGVSLLLVAVFIDLEGWLSRLQLSMGASADEGFGRLTIWSESLPIIGHFFVAGTGAGTYSDAMVHYQQSRVWVGSMQQWAHFNNAHSHYVQLAVEGGLLLMLPVAAALVSLTRLGLAAVRADKGEMFWMRIGAAAGLVGIAVQGIWEVPLVMPANAVLCGVLAGLLIHRRDPGRAASLDPSLPRETPSGRMSA